MEASGSRAAQVHDHHTSLEDVMVVGGAGRRRLLGASARRPAQARLTAETTARSDAVVMDVASPTPHTTVPPTAHST